jgi:hypothetical protein
MATINPNEDISKFPILNSSGYNQVTRFSFRYYFLDFESFFSGHYFFSPDKRLMKTTTTKGKFEQPVSQTCYS